MQKKKCKNDQKIFDHPFNIYNFQIKKIEKKDIIINGRLSNLVNAGIIA